jgi:ethanolamine-phosphate cytidylyltransferase
MKNSTVSLTTMLLYMHVPCVSLSSPLNVNSYGHMNAFRLARSLGTHLIVGVNSDESITACKGAPLMNDEERLTMVSACKFVDEVVPNCPYVMSKEYLDYVIEKYDVDYVVHGDDPCIVDGRDVYAEAKLSGKFRTIPRTDGVSTTDIVGRMLIMTKEHHLHRSMSDVSISSGSNRKETIERLGQQSKFLTTSRMLQLFSANVKAPTKGMHVVYIDGAWDLFHPGHVAILKAARERGDYLIVGIHGDAVVNSVKGMNLPLMNLHERVLSVLGCRYVSDVLIDAPYEISLEMIETLNISEVVRGTVADNMGSTHEMDTRYRQAMNTGIFSVIESSSDFRISNVIHRIQRNHETFQAKFERKRDAERLYYREKQNQFSSRA